MIKIAIVDDNQFYISEVKKLLSQSLVTAIYETYEYTSCDSFIKEIDRIHFDIVFLDIVLDKKDGIELGTIINSKQPDANIIFISSNSDYFKDVYKVKHSYFLTKDFEKERFDDAVSKVIASLSKEYIVVHEKNEICRINLKKVLYFESHLKHTKVHMSDGTVTEYNINMNDIEASISHSHFLRVHKSFIVNMAHIRRYSRQMIYLIGDILVPISRSYVNTVKEKLTLYLGDII